MTASIPASAIVNVFPNVLAAGGSGLDLGGLFLTRTERIPFGEARAFTSADTVAAYFGSLSSEAIFASVYFAGFTNSSIKPAQLLLATYPVDAARAYLRGGSLAGVTIAQLQALSGVLTLDVDGRTVTSAAINLAGATSFSAAAALIQTGLADNDASLTGVIAGTVLTATAVTGTLAVGQIIKGVGVTVGTKIASLGTGTGGAGTYNVDVSQTVASVAMTAGATTVAYDSVGGSFVVAAGTPGAGSAITAATGTLSAGVALSTATGATVSPGGAALLPGAIMDVLAANTQNFATFGTLFEPTTNDKLAFAAWTAGELNRFLYIMGDSNVVTAQPDASASAIGQIVDAGYSGIFAAYDPVNPSALAAFVAGSIASINFEAVNGRTTLAFRGSPLLTPGVTDATIAANLIANGANFYGAYATANDRFIFLNPGSVTGPYLWADSFINQIWLSNAFQLSLLLLLVNIKSIPYNAAGYALIQQALADPINAALSFGAIRAGVPLSAAQAAEVNTAAGFEIDRTLSQRGWYLLVAPASAEVRAARGSPPITFWYTDGQSVQKIALNSIQVQ